MTVFKRIDQPGDVLKRVTGFTLNTRADDVPQKAMEWAALLLLDTLGVAAAATSMSAGVLARETAVRLYGAGAGEPGCALMFDGRTTSLAGAGFATASQTDNLDAHDGFAPTKGHIGVAVVPALVAVAQNLPDLSGRDALAALAISYDIAGRAGLALHATAADYHTSGAWNGLGVAALAARLRKNSPAQLREALGIAEYNGPRSQMMREIANPTMLTDGSGMGAMVGLSAVVMAELGFTGAPAVTVEAAEVAPFWADLGQKWLVTQQYIKPYPICRWAHAPIDGAELLRNRHRITPDQIANIEISSFANAIALFPEPPRTTAQAQYSLGFAVACMLVHGAVGLDQIEGAGLTDPAVAMLISKTTLKTEQRHEDRFPAGRWGDVTITLKDGQQFNSGDINARGGVDSQFTSAEVVAKFMGLAVPVLGEARCAAIRDACLRMAAGSGKFSDLTAHLFSAP